MSFCQYFCEPQNESWKHFGMSTLLAVYAHSLPFDVFVKISYAKAPPTESKSESWALMIYWKQRCDFAAYEPVKTRLSESEAEAKETNQSQSVETSIVIGLSFLSLQKIRCLYGTIPISSDYRPTCAVCCTSLFFQFSPCIVAKWVFTTYLMLHIHIKKHLTYLWLFFTQLHVVYAQWTNVWSFNYRCGYWTLVWLLN